LEFARGGPKVSFLTQVREEDVQPLSTPKVTPQRKTQIPPELQPRETKEYEIPTPPAESRTAEKVSVGKVQIPVVIQYGPTLRSYKEIPSQLAGIPALISVWIILMSWTDTLRFFSIRTSTG
jgi:hypothetical protein